MIITTKCGTGQYFCPRLQHLCGQFSFQTGNRQESRVPFMFSVSHRGSLAFMIYSLIKLAYQHLKCVTGVQFFKSSCELMSDSSMVRLVLCGSLILRLLPLFLTMSSTTAPRTYTNQSLRLQCNREIIEHINYTTFLDIWPGELFICVN